MHIIFGDIASWQMPLLTIFKFFKLKIYYLSIDAKSDIKKAEIASKLERKKIYPPPFDLAKNILPEVLSSSEFDPNEITYEKNLKLIPEKSLIKYCKLFSLNENETKKLRLLVQDFVFKKHVDISGKLGVWSTLNPGQKIIFISFKFANFYISNTNNNIFKIIIPLNIFRYFLKIENIFSIFSKKKNNFQKMENLNSKNFEDSAKKKVALITHQGITYGTKQHIIFEKNLYYGSNSNSHLNKYNILHLDYNNYPCPERDIYWVCINKVKFSKAKISFLTLLACMKTFYLIRSWSTFLGWLICIQQYNKYIKYCEVIQKFKNLKIAIIDYDFLCPKALILALAKNNIKTVATQERFVYTFCTSFASVIVDTYYVASEFAANFIKKSKYYDVKNTIPVGQYRSDYISLYKDKNIPEEIFQSKKNGKKIIVALGFHTSALWFKASTSLYISWIAHKNFLEDIVRLSENLENTFIVLRYKHLDWADKPYFKNILNKINECENITISKNYKESFHSYKLCANADLVIAKHTSLADECLAKKTPVLFHEYTHNLKGIMAQVFDYRPSNLMCFSYEDLLKRSKSILFDQNSELKEEINFLYNKYYKIKNNNTVKETIHQYLEKHIEKSLLI